MDLRSLRSTIVSTFPELEDGSFTPLSEGWDSFAVDVDDRLIFKFPRHAARARLVGEARLLEVVRPRISLTVPELSLHEGPPLGQLQFYAELHSQEPERMQQAGAGPVDPRLPPEEIRRRAGSALEPTLCRYAEEAVAAWQRTVQ